jgi:FkbM family methyltransferase
MELRKFLKKLSNRFSLYEKYRKDSFSQCGEDLIIHYIFQNILKRTKPTYLDIGAHHPFNLSNTALFYSNGCKGINIEPNPILLKQFQKYRKRDINLNIGVGDKSCQLNFYDLSDPALSTFVKEEAENLINNGRVVLKNKYLVEILNINEIIEKYANGTLNFLSLDVEGLDEQILKSVNFEKYSPDVICVETIKYEQNGTYFKNENIINFLQSKDYTLYADTRINSIFIRTKDMNYCV